MTSTELMKGILSRLRKFKLVILICGIAVGVLLYIKAKNNRPIYTAKATVFPLTAPADNTIGNSALSGILGLEGAPKSFSNEAAINIIELSLSRNLRERVAAARVPELGNKTVTELIIQDLNKHTSFMGTPIGPITDSNTLAVLGGQLLRSSLDVKMSKNGVLELYFSSPYRELITPVTNIFIDKLSQFYIDLKITKALSDYNFTIKRIDSLQYLLDIADKKAIVMQNSTFFAPKEKLEYSIPKENLSMERTRILRQRDQSVNNREEAKWRLQKATPIISVLDKPDEPFTEAGSSPILYGIIGFMVGCILSTLMFTGGLIFNYIKAELHKSFIEKEDVNGEDGLGLSL